MVATRPELHGWVGDPEGGTHVSTTIADVLFAPDLLQKPRCARSAGRDDVDTSHCYNIEHALVWSGPTRKGPGHDDALDADQRRVHVSCRRRATEPGPVVLSDHREARSGATEGEEAMRAINQSDRLEIVVPGDLIFTGTPGGIGWTRQPKQLITASDELVGWAEGIGEMRHRFVQAPSTTAVSHA